ncbi:MAG: hypothetical protein P4L38_13400 [Syntrophaceae bacterium]|nr:hypothetical protein [Syntrophaceae bacterium]
MSSFPKKFVVDTNVPKTANYATDPENIPSDLKDCVVECIAAIKKITERKDGLVLDSGGEIFGEYLRNLSMSGQPGVGNKFLKWVHDHQWGFPYEDHVVINKEGDSYSEFPNTKDLSQFDPADKKFVAVAKAHPAKPPILQATDCKWLGWKNALEKEGIIVNFLCPDYVALHYEEKRGV